MEFSTRLNKLVGQMRPSKNKQLWEELRQSERVYTYIPTVYQLNDDSKDFTSYMNYKSLEGLQGLLRYYNHVRMVYNSCDFILTPLFYEDNIRENEIDILHVSDKSRKQVATMCNRLSKKIEKMK